jgi:two-component system sensor histidine kinase BaeS
MLDGVYDRNDDRLETTLEETKYLVHLIDDLHLLSMLESGALQLNREPTDILPLIREIQRSLRGRAEEAGVSLSVKENDDVPLAYVDPVRLREILINLHTNAIQHLPDGCSVTAKAYPIEGDRIQVEIDDDGPGMEPDQVQQAFLRFTKSSESAGSGLGLSIVKSLVEAHGGEVGITSEPGRGTKVSFIIPKAE